MHAGATRKGQPVQLPLAEHNALSVNRAALAPAILPGLPPPTEQAAFLAGIMLCTSAILSTSWVLELLAPLDRSS